MNRPCLSRRQALGDGAAALLSQAVRAQEAAARKNTSISPPHRWQAAANRNILYEEWEKTFELGIEGKVLVVINLHRTRLHDRERSAGKPVGTS